MIKKLVDTIINVFHLNKDDSKKKYGYFSGFLSIFVNVVLFGVKAALGLLLNSISLMADAVHSLSDTVTSVVLVIGFKMASKPADREHPFGHGRAETIASVVISCLLIVVGIEFFFNGFKRFMNPVLISFNWVIILILVATIVLKELLFYIASEFSKRIGSKSLKADAWHHRTDSLSTVMVVIGLILMKFGVIRVDGVVGMAVAVFIIYTGVVIIKASASALLGEAPSPTFIDKLKEIATRCEGITDVHHIHVHDYGGNLEITIHVRLEPDTHLDKVHAKISEVEQCIKDSVKGAEVTVHAEPDEK